MAEAGQWKPQPDKLPGAFGKGTFDTDSDMPHTEPSFGRCGDWHEHWNSENMARIAGALLRKRALLNWTTTLWAFQANTALIKVCGLTSTMLHQLDD